MEERTTKSVTARTELEGSDQTEQSLLIIRRKEIIDWLREKYETVIINEYTMFLTPGGIAHLVTFPEDEAFCFEFAQTEEEAKNYMLEDGVWYYLEDLTLEEMKKEMLEELENAF